MSGGVGGGGAAKLPPIPIPIVVLIMSLFAPAPMTDDGILHANRAVAHNDFRARIGPIRFEVVLRGGKWDKQYRDRWGPARDVAVPQIELEGGTFTSRIKSRLEKNNAFRLAHLPLPRLAG